MRKTGVNRHDYAEDQSLKQQLDSYLEQGGSRLNTVLGHFGCNLGCRFSQIRTGDAKLSNFVTDVMLTTTHSNMALLTLTVIKVSGHQISKALGNGVSQYPKLKGRFPQVTGVQFSFDPSNMTSNRITFDHIRIGDKRLDLYRNH